MSGPFVITGASGGAANRLEINDFVKDVKFFSLYIQALDAMYKFDQLQLQSFFQLGGIHGLPYTPWNGVAGNPPYDWGGYCTHESVLFPTWHRPYVMAYEQIVQARAREIADRYTTADKEDWKNAALLLRQPYWDWAENSVPPDEVILLAQVSIIKPETNGNPILVDNPLLHYRFHPIDPSFRSPYSGWATTLRYPTSQQPDARSDIPGLINQLSGMQLQITAQTYRTLTRVQTWAEFSNHTVTSGITGSVNSLETIHDWIHGLVGQSPMARGHMGDPAYAAFDPIFMMHHCNTDRLLSLWSALNPDIWVTPGTSEDGTFTIRPDATVDNNTGLTPFWNSKSDFWASANVRDTSQLGYSYPDFNGLDLGNRDAVRNAIGNIINRLYNDNSNPLARLVSAVSTAEGGKSEQVSGIPAQIPEGSQLSAPNIGVYDWTARVEFKHNELRESFSVLIFLGHVPEDPAEWTLSSNYIGGHYAFVNSVAEKCARCTVNEGELEEGFVHLNHGIAKHSRLTSLDPNVVEPYLTSNLQWRVQKTGGVEASLESLEVTVIATRLTYPPGAMFPVPGETRRYNGITRGRRGGSRA